MSSPNALWESVHTASNHGCWTDLSSEKRGPEKGEKKGEGDVPVTGLVVNAPLHGAILISKRQKDLRHLSGEQTRLSDLPQGWSNHMHDDAMPWLGAGSRSGVLLPLELVEWLIVVCSYCFCLVAGGSLWSNPYDQGQANLREASLDYLWVGLGGGWGASPSVLCVSLCVSLSLVAPSLPPSLCSSSA